MLIIKSNRASFLYRYVRFFYYMIINNLFWGKGEIIMYKKVELKQDGFVGMEHDVADVWKEKDIIEIINFKEYIILRKKN